MKRTAKNERTNDQNATKRSRNGGENATGSTDPLSRALRGSTAALVITCGVCVVASGCQSFLGADAERFRRGRGEYALNDANVVRDWERAARETSEETQNAAFDAVGETGKMRENGRSGENASSDPAATQPILRSAAFDESDERRVSALKPLAEEPEEPKTFGERVKGLFSFGKKEPKRPAYSEEAVYLRERAKFEKSVNSARSGSRVKPEKNAEFARSGASEKSARSGGNGFSLGRGLSSVLPSSKRRGREKFPVDPVLQYDESRFMPSFQTCEQYYSPIRPTASSERLENSEEPVKAASAARSGKSAQTVQKTTVADAGADATRTSAKRRAGETRVSGRELVYREKGKRKSEAEETAGTAKSGVLTARKSATGWGKTRPASVAVNEESATAKAPVASVAFWDVASKNETNFQLLTERCDGFFGWETADEALLNAISEPTGETGESLTAYSTAPTPTAPAFPAVELSDFATEVAEIATGNEELAPTQAPSALLQNVAPTSVAQIGKTASNAATAQIGETASNAVTAQIGEMASNAATAQVGETASNAATAQVGETAMNAATAQVGETALNAATAQIGETASNAAIAQVGETASNPGTAPVLTAYAPSGTQKKASERTDFASQLGETGFDWFDSRANNGATQPANDAAPVAPTVATIEPEIASSVPDEAANRSENETLELVAGAPRVDLDAALARRLAPSPVAEVGAVGEVASNLPVSEAVVPSPVAEVGAVGEVASSLPVSESVAPSPVAELGSVGEVASSLPVSESVAPFPVAEVGSVGEVASSLPVSDAGAPSPIAEVGEVTQALTPVVAEKLDLEAPQALPAVEIENATGQENGVAGPNFALAAPGLGAGEAIQDAADERKNAAVAKPLSGDEIAWVEQIKGAIRTLVAERDAKKAAGEDVRRLDARLRLLYLAVDEYDRSIQEIQDDADPLKVFWETERGELETLLQSRLEEIDPTFVAERLRAGLDSLAGLCDLQIRKSALVVAPACFGLYEERAEGYKPGETVFAYAELEYVSCRETENGRLIDVECRWRLLNADGSELTPGETQRCSNLSETKLRDVVLNVSAPLPNDLAPGTYLLETEVVDMNRPDAKPAKERLELTVVAGENVENAAE